MEKEMTTLKKLLAVLIAMLIANPCCCCSSEPSANAESSCCAKKNQAPASNVPCPDDRPCDSCSAKSPKLADGNAKILKSGPTAFVLLPAADLVANPRQIAEEVFDRAHPTTAPPPRSARERLVMRQSFLI